MPSATTGRIFVFSAPSGAGKSTLLDHLRAAIPNLYYSISATTRSPRGREVNGVHYHFLTESQFKAMIERGDFAEWQIVHNRYYGTPRKPIDDAIAAGQHVVMDIDVYGKRKFDVLYPDAVGVLILPPSMEVLEQRLRARATDSEEQIRIRLRNAADEIEFARSKGKYEYSIVNANLEQAKKDVVALVARVIGPQQQP